MDLPLTGYLIFIAVCAAWSVAKGYYVAVVFSLMLALFCFFFYRTRKSNTKLPSVVNILILMILMLGMFAAFFGLFSMVEQPRRDANFMRFGAFVIFGMIAYSIKIGKSALLRDLFVVYRKKNPVAFWFFTTLWTAFGLLFFISK